MSEGVPAALKKPGAGLVELESELEALLVEYEPLSQAWPKEPHAVARAEIGRKMEDALGRIYELHRAITRTQAETLPDAAVQIRRALAAIEAHDCKSPFAEVERTEIILLASALAVVERMVP
jgi:hypothetical protein